MRFGLDVAQQRMPWDELVSRVQFAEELGFDGAWGFDHFQPMYGDGPGETFDGMTTLAALAGVTSRIRLGLLVAGVTYRHPSVFAAQALTIDHASHGRLELSLGAAWFDKEHDELGIPFPSTSTRFDLLEDALEIVQRLFTGDVVSYEGEVVSLQRRPAAAAARCSSPTRRSGSAAAVPAARCRSSRSTPTCGTRGASPNSLREANARIDELAVEAGRDPAAIMRASSLSLDDLETARKHASKWRDAGCGYLVCGWPEAGRSRSRPSPATCMPEFTRAERRGLTAPSSRRRRPCAEPVVQREASLAR